MNSPVADLAGIVLFGSRATRLAETETFVQGEKP